MLTNNEPYKYSETFKDDNEVLITAGDICDPPELLKDALDTRSLSYNKTNKDYYFPCTYDTCEADAKLIASSTMDINKKIFLIDGCDVLASKLDLWRKLRNKFGKDAGKYMPTTYLLEEDTGFSEHFTENMNKNPNQMYVLKNFKQRQEGIKLTRDLKYIETAYHDGWYLVQDYVYDPYLIAKRKINFRYYLLIVCQNNKIEGYLYNDGFLYYTPDEYDAESEDFNKHITTGYIDRKIYDNNPLTIQDFRNYIDNKQRGSSKIWDTNAKDLMVAVMTALDGEICNNDSLKPYLKFQLFGCDLAPDSKLGVKLMEINKGPDIGAKDKRDRELKRQLQDDIIDLVETRSNTNTNFVKIY